MASESRTSSIPCKNGRKKSVRIFTRSSQVLSQSGTQSVTVLARRGTANGWPRLKITFRSKGCGHSVGKILRHRSTMSEPIIGLSHLVLVDNLFAKASKFDLVRMIHIGTDHGRPLGSRRSTPSWKLFGLSLEVNRNRSSLASGDKLSKE